LGREHVAHDGNEDARSVPNAEDGRDAVRLVGTQNDR
jgi:hypothetical protein